MLVTALTNLLHIYKYRCGNYQTFQLKAAWATCYVVCIGECHARCLCFAVVPWKALAQSRQVYTDLQLAAMLHNPMTADTQDLLETLNCNAAVYMWSLTSISTIFWRARRWRYDSCSKSSTIDPSLPWFKFLIHLHQNITLSSLWHVQHTLSFHVQLKECSRVLQANQ